MVELVDTRDLKSLACKGMRVRAPLEVPFNIPKVGHSVIGNTMDFGSIIQGSSPCAPAIYCPLAQLVRAADC